ncbi:ABC transporter substrate-binding protein [Nonomuraea ferruginea]
MTGDIVKANLEAQKASPLNTAVFQPLDSIELTDPMTVTVKLKQPWVAFPYYLAAQVGMIVPPSSLADPQAASLKPVGTGPFVFKEYVPDSRMVVTKNPRYWRSGLPYLDEIEFRVLPDSQTRAQTLEAERRRRHGHHPRRGHRQVRRAEGRLRGVPDAGHAERPSTRSCSTPPSRRSTTSGCAGPSRTRPTATPSSRPCAAG